MTKPSAIELLEQQEAMLVLDRFDEDVAFHLGLALHAAAVRQSAPVTIDIRSASRRYFYVALPGSHPDNESWARRKGNVALRCHASSYLVKLRLEAEGRSPWPDAALETQEFAVHGGGFPIRVRSCGVIACAAISGLPSHLDHDLIVAVLREQLNAQGVPDTPNPVGCP